LTRKSRSKEQRLLDYAISAAFAAEEDRYDPEATKDYDDTAKPHLHACVVSLFAACRWELIGGNKWVSGCAGAMEFDETRGPAFVEFKCCPFCGHGIESAAHGDMQ